MEKLYNKVNSEELKRLRLAENEKRITLSFYVYTQLENPALFRDHLYKLFDQLDICGRIYVASEGVNAQLNVPERTFDQFKQELHNIAFFKDMRLNIAVDQNAFSFYKLIVKLKSKIVADGLNDASFDVTKRGHHIDAIQFNALAEKDGTIIVDMRNHYESEVGHFKDAICPDVETFRESLPIVEELLAEKKDKPILMYCTGGIRCEKASAYFKHKGFEHVYQLDGGIIEYARKTEELGIENKFVGKNFVFDERMGERISDHIISKCHQCGCASDHHVNCQNDACHILFIQCEACANKYQNCCSKKCSTFNELEEADKIELRKTIQFNGTKFGKGRYKALMADEDLDLS
jgi:UPF0176 protein